MAKGGIIMDVTTAEEAKVAENAGVSLATRQLDKSLYICKFVSLGCFIFVLLQACAVMSLERVPADIRKQGGVARMTDPKVQWIFL